MKGFVILFTFNRNKSKNVTNVPYLIGTKKTSLEVDWACDMTDAVSFKDLILRRNI